MSDRLRWAVIGSGNMSAGIAAAIAADEGAELRAVVTRTPATTRAFAARYRIPLVTTSRAEAFRVADAVYVGSPNALHEADALAAIDAGCHVLCDKPLATDPAAARRLVEAAARRGVRLGVNLQTRHHPALATLRAVLAAGSIGSLEHVDAALSFGLDPLTGWRADPDLAGAGTLYNLGVHVVDTVLALVDRPIVELVAIATPTGGLDTSIDALVRFSGGAVAVIHASQAERRDDVRLELRGSAGDATWTGWLAPYRTGRLIVRGATPLDIGAAAPDAYRRLVAAFTEAIRRDERFDPDPSAILATVDAVEGIREASRSGRAVRSAAAG